MLQNHHFEKVSSADLCAHGRNPVFPTLWRSRKRNGIKFALLILAISLIGGAGQAAAEGSPPPLDLNRATSAQLEGLPGIGAVKAAAILAVRDAQGGFDSLEQLESVRGIGPALVTKLRPLVHLGKSGAGLREAGSKVSVKSSDQKSAKPKISTGSRAKTSARPASQKAQ